MIFPTTCLTHGTELKSATHIKHMQQFLEQNPEVTTLPLTDVGNVSQCVEYYNHMTKIGKKPVLGCQVPLCETFSDLKEDSKNTGFNVLMYAQNIHGWQEMLNVLRYINDPDKMCPMPRISMEELQQFDLGGLSIAAPLDYSQNLDKSKDFFYRSKTCTGPAPDLRQIDYSQNSFLFTDHTDRLEAVLKKGKYPEEYIRKYARGYEGLIDLDHAFAKNNMALYDMIEEFDIRHKEELPAFCDDDNAELIKQCEEGLRRIGKENDNEYRERLNKELDIFCPNNLSGYFLIMSDIIRHCHSSGQFTGIGRGCLSGDSLVITESGVKEIKNVQIGDRVITRSGSLNKVEKVWEYDCDEELLEIACYHASGRLKLTRDHKVLVRKRQSYKENVLCSDGCRRNLSRKRYLDPKWVEASELSVGDMVFHPKVKFNQINDFVIDLAKFDDGNRLTSTKDKCQHWHLVDGGKYLQREYVRYIEYDEDLAYIAGVFVGDGHWDADGNTLYFSLNKIRKRKCIEKIESFCQKYNIELAKIELKKGKDNSSIRLCIRCVHLFGLFRNWFDLYERNSYTKHVPKIIFNSPDRFKQAFINGCADTDGSRRNIKDKVAYTTEYSTVSFKLAWQLKVLNMSLREPCSLRTYLRKNGISENTVTLNVKSNNPSKKHIKENNGCWSSVRSIELVENPDNKVYDLKVENEHNYYTSCGLVHNSAGGCLVSYLTNIIQIDPIKYGLMFERFFTIDRVGSWPDIDLDVPPSFRDQLVEYIANKYGTEKLGQLSTFGTIKGSAALKLCLGNSGMNFFQQNAVTDFLPQEAKVAPELKEQNDQFGTKSLVLYSLRNNPDDFMKWVSFDPKTNKITGKWAKEFQLAIDLDGTHVSIGKHASAFVLANGPIHDNAPMRYDLKSKRHVVGVEMNSASSLGLVKLDLLSLDLLDKAKKLQEGLQNGNFFLEYEPWRQI